jgi:excisionase family DNA binding protein
MSRPSVPPALCRPDPIPLTDRLAWSVDEAARMVGVSDRLLEQYIARGDLACIRVGRRVLLSPDAVRAWLASLESAGPQNLADAAEGD